MKIEKYRQAHDEFRKKWNTAHQNLEAKHKKEMQSLFEAEGKAYESLPVWKGEGHYCDGGFSVGGVSTSFYREGSKKDCHCRKDPFRELKGDHH